MKFALFFLLLLVSCRPSLLIQSDVAFTNREQVIKRDSRVTWYIYTGQRYTAWLREDAGICAIMIIPNSMHGREFQFKKTHFTIVGIEERRDEFVTKITSDEGVDYEIVLGSRQHVGSIFEAWIPR